MEAKHYEILGNNIKRMMQSQRIGELKDELIGHMVVQYVEMLQQEAERDARDKQNGKGE